MSGAPPNAEVVALAEDDSALLRFARQGDAQALGRLAERHFDFLYGVLRMTLPTTREVEDAIAHTFAALAARGDGAISGRGAASSLTAIAIEQIASRANRPISIEERRRRRGSTGPDPARAEPDPELLTETLPAVRDDALAAMVRTLDIRSRQALVLTLICGLEDAEAASAIGRGPAEVARLREEALAELERQICEHGRRRRALRRELTETNPYDLVTAVGGGGGSSAGTRVDSEGRVYPAPPPETNILKLLRRAMKRLIERWRRRDDHDLGEDDVGGSGPRKALDPTPTQQAFERPKSTPSTAAYRKPEATVGTAAYRIPKATPSTARLSNSSRPALATANAWASKRQGRR